MSRVADRLEKLGLTLPELKPASGSYVPCVRSGNLLFVSGQLPLSDDGSVITGKVGLDASVELAQDAARRAGLSLIAVASSALDSLDRVSRVVRIGGFVNAEPSFGGQPGVINGCSELMIEVWGEAGRHSRAAVGVAGLPAGAVVEVDAIFEVD